MQKGTIKWYNSKKGYGFISPENGGKDIFVHHTALQLNDANTLQDGQKVEYEVVPGPKGEQAAQVSIV